jgi:hypothetical protein
VRRALVIALVALAAPGIARAGVSVGGSVQPSTVHFGDRFRYVVEAEGVGDGRLRVIADPGAFEIVGAPTTTRSGDTVHITETLICLSRACVPNDTPRVVTLPAPKAFFGAESITGAAVNVTVAPRVSAAAVKRGKYVEQKDIAPVHVRLALGAGISIAFAAVLIGIAAALAWRRRRMQAAAAGWTGTRLELALRFLRESAGRPVDDRRRAADFAARATEGSVADEATRLAWGPPEPGAADVETLADDVERAAR